MRILFASTPAPGHLNPLLAIARLAKARGDDVLVTTGSALAPLVEAAGFRFAPLLAEADLDFRHLDVTDPERAKLPPGPAQLKYDFERIFLDSMTAQAETLRALIANEAPDLIVADNLFCGTTPIFLDRSVARPPIVTCGITFLSLDRPDGAPMGLGLPPARDGADRECYAAIAAEVNAAFTSPVRAYADAKLAAMGLPALDADLMHARVLHCEAFLMPTVPSFEYDFGAFPDHIHFVGALPAPPIGAPVPDWWPELDGGRKIVLVTQGTVANVDLGQLIEPTLTALTGRDDLLVVVTTGGRPTTDIKVAIPDNARIASFLPFEALLPKTDLLVTNGGYGTVSLALKAGVPIVVAGLTEDKAEVSTRVAWSGTGVNLATNNPTPEALRAGVAEVLANPCYGERARALAAEFAAIDTPKEVLAILDRVACARDAAAIGQIVDLEVRSGCEQQFEALFRDLAEAVRRHETGAQVYQLVRSRTMPNLYKIMELYADQAALDRHHESRHYREAREATRALLMRPPAVHAFDVPA